MHACMHEIRTREALLIRKERNDRKIFKMRKVASGKKGNIPAIPKDSISTASLGGVCLLSDYTSGYRKKASVSIEH
jgi:hypothetical protein